MSTKGTTRKSILRDIQLVVDKFWKHNDPRKPVEERHALAMTALRRTQELVLCERFVRDSHVN
jgi:hypothetical protein